MVFENIVDSIIVLTYTSIQKLHPEILTLYLRFQRKLSFM